MKQLVEEVCMGILELPDGDDLNEAFLYAGEIVRKYKVGVASEFCLEINDDINFTDEEIDSIKDSLVERLNRNPFSFHAGCILGILAKLGDESLKPLFEKYISHYLSYTMLGSGCLHQITYGLSLLGEDVLEFEIQGAGEHEQNVSQAFNYCKRKKLPLAFYRNKPYWPPEDD